MSDERDKQVKYHIREALRLMENVDISAPYPEVTKKTKPEISHKSSVSSTDNDNPQNTQSGLSWSHRGDYIYFTVPYKYKDGFKALVSAITKQDKPLRWIKDKKQWELHEKYATEELFGELTIAIFEPNKEEHVL